MLFHLKSVPTRKKIIRKNSGKNPVFRFFEIFVTGCIPKEGSNYTFLDSPDSSGSKNTKFSAVEIFGVFKSTVIMLWSANPPSISRVEIGIIIFLLGHSVFSCHNARIEKNNSQCHPNLGTHKRKKKISGIISMCVCNMTMIILRDMISFASKSQWLYVPLYAWCHARRQRRAKALKPGFPGGTRFSVVSVVHQVSLGSNLSQTWIWLKWPIAKLTEVWPRLPRLYYPGR